MLYISSEENFMTITLAVPQKYNKILIIRYLPAPNILVKQESSTLANIKIPLIFILQKQTNIQQTVLTKLKSLMVFRKGLPCWLSG